MKIARDLLRYQSEMFQDAIRLLGTDTLCNGLSFAVFRGLFERHHYSGPDVSTREAGDRIGIAADDGGNRKGRHIYDDIYLLGDKMHTECAVSVAPKDQASNVV